MTQEVTDLSDTEIGVELWRQIAGDGKVYRLNEGQFQSIAPVDKKEEASRVFGMYSSIPIRTYYSTMLGDFYEGITAKEVNKHGSPSQWFSKKRFEGFTMHIPCISVYAFDCFPDRYVYIPWDLLSACPFVEIGSCTTIFRELNLLEEEGVRKSIDRNYNQWQRFFWKVVPEDTMEGVRWLKEEYNFTLKESSETKGRKFETWDDVYSHQIEDIRTPTTFNILHTNSTYESLGFIPETESLSSSHELSDFVMRFLNFQEKGNPFQSGQT